MTEMKISQIIFPTLFGAILLGITIYFHHKISLVNSKTDEILDLMTQQQRVLLKHDSIINREYEEEEEYTHPTPRQVSPQPRYHQEFEEINTPSPEIIETPKEVKKSPIIVIGASLDKELMEELNELKKEQEECESEPRLVCEGDICKIEEVVEKEECESEPRLVCEGDICKIEEFVEKDSIENN
jgi:hypothetical protein